jgi:hypothetical protein
VGAGRKKKVAVCATFKKLKIEDISRKKTEKATSSIHFLLRVKDGQKSGLNNSPKEFNFEALCDIHSKRSSTLSKILTKKFYIDSSSRFLKRRP